MNFGGDIDDLYAAPNSSILPTLKRVHNIGKVKGSSWADIGPSGQKDGREMKYPRIPWEKKAGRKSCFDESVRLAVKDPRLTLIKGKPFAGSGDRAHFWLEDKRRKIIDPTASQYPESTRTYTGGRVVSLEKNRDAVAKALEKKAYRLQGHTSVQGMRIAIENQKGSVRKGTDSDGKEWRTKMIYPYGYIVGTKGADGEPVDAYVGPDKEAPNAFVVHQRKVDGTGYDEDKVMLGFQTKKEAKEAYLKHYNSDKFLGPMARVSVDRLRELTRSKKKLVKIAATKEPEQGKVTRFLRKAGPGIGGAIGLGAGALIGARRGKLLQGALAGLGTGATLGWTPDMAHGVAEGVRGLR